MDWKRLEDALARAGRPVPWPEGDILTRLLRGEADEAHAALIRLADDDPGRVEALMGHGIAAWTLEQCPPLREAAHPALQFMQQAAMREFAACAQRKAAVHLLNDWARENACTPIVFKGAATAATFYAKESLRPSQDIDIILPESDILRLFPDTAEEARRCGDLGFAMRHLPEMRLAGYGIEVHAFFLDAEAWGTYGDLAAGAVALDEFPALLRPSPPVCATIALLHMLHHSEGFTFDALDLQAMLGQGSLDWGAAEALWRETGLVATVLPALAIFGALTHAYPQERWEALYRALPLTQRVSVGISLAFLRARHLSRLRQDWFHSRLANVPMTRPLGRRLFRDGKQTQRETGYSPRHPLFWLHHFILLPLGRLARFWK